MQKKDLKIEVKIDEDTAAGKYSNFVNISNSDDEFTFDYVYINPNPYPGFGKLMSRIILSPSNAKKMLLSLKNAVDVYELNNGVIKINEEIPETSENLQ